MGKIYHFRCKQCGYDQEFKTGGGFFSEAHMDETDKRRNQLEKELLTGKYGSVFQTLAQTGNLEYDCDTALYQCSICRGLTVRRGKRVESQYHQQYGKSVLGSKVFVLSVEFDKHCTQCGFDHMEQIDINTVICPHCKDRLLELVNCGWWD